MTVPIRFDDDHVEPPSGTAALDRLSLDAAARASGLDHGSKVTEFTRTFHPVRPRMELSGLRFLNEPPRVVFLHGAGQSGHTWDEVTMRLGEPSLALDLPGHGFSSWRKDRDYRPQSTAPDLHAAIRSTSERGVTLVGMSLGGMTAISIAAADDESWIGGVIVLDILPSPEPGRHRLTTSERGALNLFDGPRKFTSFAAMVDFTARATGRPRRDVATGVASNARQVDDGSWSWRYDIEALTRFPPTTAEVWGDWEKLKTPTMLVKGGSSNYVEDQQIDELRRRVPPATITVVPGAGHSIQRHKPQELADIIASFRSRHA